MNGRFAGLVRAIDGLNAAAAWIARWAVLLMLAIGFWNVVGRYVGSAIRVNLSSNGLIEAQNHHLGAIVCSRLHAAVEHVADL